MAKNLRAIDQVEFSEKNRKDFKNRNHGLSSKRIFELVLALLAVTLGTMILVYLETLVGGLVCAGAGFVLLAFALQTEKYKVILERAEFLNALMTNAAAEGYKFCAVAVKKNGKIVYLNQDFQKLFPKAVELENRTVPKMLSAYKVDKAKAKSFYDAVKKGTKKSIQLEFTDGKKKTKMKVTTQSIKRPEGFVIIRGE